MGFLDFPNPADWFTSVKDDDQKRALINAAQSAMYSSWITFMWRSGSSRLAQWFGEGAAMQEAAISAYLTLSNLETKNFLTLTVPQDMLNADLLAKFQTERKVK